MDFFYIYRKKTMKKLLTIFYIILVSCGAFGQSEIKTPTFDKLFESKRNVQNGSRQFDFLDFKVISDIVPNKYILLTTNYELDSVMRFTILRLGFLDIKKTEGLKVGKMFVYQLKPVSFKNLEERRVSLMRTMYEFVRLDFFSCFEMGKDYRYEEFVKSQMENFKTIRYKK